ncbi:hypothetical protein D3C73_1299420 [compost metagenome]
MDFVGGEFSRKAFGAAVRHEMNCITTIAKLMSESFCRKQMTAGSPGGKNDRALIHLLTPRERHAQPETGSAPVPAFRAGDESTPG